MSHLFYLIFFLLIISAQSLSAQKKWDGEAANNQWSDPVNWTGNLLPAPTDDVLLDNSVVAGSYNVVLPLTAVIVKTITLAPAVRNIIELELPKTNKAIPALTLTRLVINQGGVFRN